MKNIVQDKRFIILFLSGVLVCFLYLGTKSTYTSYESQISGTMKNSIAGIHLKLNGVDVAADDQLDNDLILNNITWTSTHTRQGKISPGSSGTINLELDPTGSEVAVLYEFQFLDKVVDTDKLLTFDTITSDDTGFTRTGVDTYAGIITLADINNSKKIHLQVGFYFDSLVDIPGITEDNQVFDDFFEIHFHAIQYRGETLTPYSGG